MALMIPSDIEEFETKGEQKVYSFLEAVAKPDSKYIAWYTPDIKGREPDFVLFCNEVGLIVLEVKDWSLEQIKKADPKNFVLSMGNKDETRKNPLTQARGYYNSIIDRIKTDGRLVSASREHHGNPSIPIDYGVIFPNINKYEYEEKKLNSVIDSTKIFFWDDLNPASDIRSDPTGNAFLEALRRMFPPKFDFNLPGKSVDHLKQLLFPTVKIELPERNEEDEFYEQLKRLKVLDHNQEALARKFDGGHRIITGPSGSGKTLVLVHKAAFLKKYNKKIKNILFVCYNITLVKYIRRLLSAKKVPIGENGIKLVHIFELCSEIIGEDVAYEKEDTDYYDLIIQETLNKVQDCGMKFDAILVDEGQDISDDMYKIITALLNKDTNSLTIVFDDQQNVYQRGHSWKELGINAQGRVHRIPKVYRNTKEITEFAFNFIGKEGEKSDNLQQELFPDYYEFRGPKPEIKKYSGFDETVFSMAKTIEDLVEEGLPYSEIAVLYAMKHPRDMPEIHIPEMIKQSLEEKGILYEWASEDYNSKNSYDITTNSVTISTIHSVKGLDYSCVFLIGLDLLEPDRWSEEQIDKMTYVAVTRARYRLYIPYFQKNSLIEKLLKCV